MEQLRETDGIIETSSNVSTPFQTSNENISVNENENKTAFKLQTTERSTSSNEMEALGSSDSKLSSQLDNESLSKNKKVEAIQMRSR